MSAPHGRLTLVGGVENVRGIFYQHAHSVLTALDVVGDPGLEYLMVEGIEDVMDIAVFDHDRILVLAKQVKTRTQAYTWGRGELLSILRRWLELDDSQTASFQFVTDGRLGTTGEKVKVALVAAASGDLAPAAELLDLPVTDPAVAAISRCTIHQDELGVEPVLAEAEREVRTLHVPTTGDADSQARIAVDRLLVQISKQAGLPDPEDRLLATAQILELIDGTAAVEPRNRWDTPLRTEYVTRVGAVTLAPLVQVSAVALDAAGNRPDSPTSPTSLADLLEPQFATLSGRTGSGKSSATHLIRAAGASASRAVILVHAEAYVPGRLDSLIAESLSSVVGRDLPTLTGRQALADGTATIVIDGVSEVPESIRDALATELRAPTAKGTGSHIIVVGRDLAALRAVYSTSTTLSRYELNDLDPTQRTELATAALTGTGLDSSTELAKAEHALGDLVSNPMLLTMALGLLAAGADFHDRASLYAGVINEMAARTGATSMSVTTAVLGVVYAKLLDEERRYANEYEWQRRITQACDLLKTRGIAADPVRVQTAADQSGLVTHVGHTQVRIPAHDSFADYLAGVAHSEALHPLPRPLRPGDEQRVLFAGEFGGVTTESATALAHDLPFATLRHARNDARAPDQTTPEEVAALLHILAPETQSCGVQIWATGTRVVASIVDHQTTGWVDINAGRELMNTVPTAVVDVPNGPLAIAARLWAFHIETHLKRTKHSEPAAVVKNINDAAIAMEQHATEVASTVSRILDDTFTPTAINVLRSRIGPLGMRGLVQASPAPHTGPNDFALHYEQTDTVTVRVATPDEAAAIDADWTRFPGTATPAVSTRTDFVLHADPHDTATKKIRDAANTAAGVDWLR